MRFRLDPKEADAPVEVPARNVPPPVNAPAPEAHAAPASSGWTKQRFLVVAVIAILLLGGGTGAVLYATDSGPFKYPHAYLVEGSAVPSGLKLSGVPEDVAQQYDITSNPGEISKDRLDEFGDGATRPDRAWIESLDARNAPEAVTIVALKFADTDHANTFRQTAQLRCGFGGAALLQDGDVVVLVLATGAGLSYYSQVMRVIQTQVSSIKHVCG